MKINDGKFQYKGEEYELVFNLNVMQEIQDVYGSLDEWGEKTGGGESEPDAKAILIGITSMINEGIDIYNEEHGTDRKPLKRKQVGRMMSDIGLQEVTQAMQDTVINSTTSDEPKNE